MRLLLLGLLVAATAHAQTGTISGTVRDAETGESLPGAPVYVAGTLLTTTAGADGRFVIRDVPVGTYSVRASFPGYQSAEATLTVDGDVRFDAALRVGFPMANPIDGYFPPGSDRSPMTSRVLTGDEIARLPIGR